MKSDGFLWLLNTSVALQVKPGYRLRIVARYCTMELQWSSPTAILIQTHVIMTVTVPCDLKCSLYSKHKSRSQKSCSPVASLTGFSILLLTFKVCETTSPLSELLKLTLSIDIHPHHLTAWDLGTLHLWSHPIQGQWKNTKVQAENGKIQVEKSLFCSTVHNNVHTNSIVISHYD